MDLWETAYSKGGTSYLCASAKAAMNLRGQLNGFRKALNNYEQHQATARKFNTLLLRITKAEPKIIHFVKRSEDGEAPKISEFIDSQRT